MTKYYWILGHLSLLPCRLKHSILAKHHWGKGGHSHFLMASMLVWKYQGSIIFSNFPP